MCRPYGCIRQNCIITNISVYSVDLLSQKEVLLIVLFRFIYISFFFINHYVPVTQAN